MNNDPQSFFIGMDGFYWFIAVIESLEDPQKVGRCKARIIGWHDADKAKLATNELPWAYPVLPISQATTMPNYKVGDWVLGFFLDGKMGQQPMLIGVLPAAPTPGGLLKKAISSAAKNAAMSAMGIPPGTF
jgi:hypothetical protein